MNSTIDAATCSSPNNRNHMTSLQQRGSLQIVENKDLVQVSSKGKFGHYGRYTPIEEQI